MPVYIPPSRGSGTTADISGNFVTLVGDQIVAGQKSWLNKQVFISDIELQSDIIGEVLIRDNIIVLNKGETSDGVSSGFSGIEIDRGTANTASLKFSENSLSDDFDNRWVIDIGDGAEEEILYNNIPDDVTFNGLVTINNDSVVNFDFIISSLAGYENQIVTLTNSGQLTNSGFTLSSLQEDITGLQSQIDSISLVTSGGIFTINQVTETDTIDLVSSTLSISGDNISKQIWLEIPSNYVVEAALSSFITYSEVASISASLQDEISNLSFVETINGVTSDSINLVSSTIGIAGNNTNKTVVLSLPNDLVYQDDISDFVSQTDLDNYVEKSGDTMTGDLTMDSANIVITDGDFKLNEVTYSAVITNNIDSNTVIDEFPITLGNAGFWDILITDGINYRASRVTAVWNSIGTILRYNEVSSESIGDTGDVDMNITIFNGTHIRVKALPAAGVWNMRISRKVL